MRTDPTAFFWSVASKAKPCIKRFERFRRISRTFLLLMNKYLSLSFCVYTCTHVRSNLFFRSRSRETWTLFPQLEMEATYSSRKKPALSLIMIEMYSISLVIKVCFFCPSLVDLLKYMSHARLNRILNYVNQLYFHFSWQKMCILLTCMQNVTLKKACSLSPSWIMNISLQTS